ncbi:hypothetical protein TNCT_471501, partial [Trichonephila clavata]
AQRNNQRNDKQVILCYNSRNKKKSLGGLEQKEIGLEPPVAKAAIVGGMSLMIKEHDKCLIGFSEIR